MTPQTTTASPSNGNILDLARHESLEWARRDGADRARHKTEFETLSTLGRGAFGTTYEVRNRVDSRLYALKCVRLFCGTTGTGAAAAVVGPDPDECARVLREVEVLSGICSENVVRYYGAWVERGDMEFDDEGGDDGSFLLGGSSSCSSFETGGISATASHDGECVDTSDEAKSSRLPTSGPDVPEHYHGCHLCQSLCSGEVPVCHLCNSTYKDWEVSFEHWGLIDAVLQPLDLCTDCYVKSLPPGVDTGTITVREKDKLPLYIFILMEFCDRTLDEAVGDCRRKNGGDDDSIVWSYFAQCVQGVAHLHSRGVIHRDVKPGNIFVRNGVVKIGDLGLARTYTPSPSKADRGRRRASGTSCCKGKSSHSSPPKPPLESERSNDVELKSSRVGTFLYTAPEVATGNYDEKCDVYSLGVVLVEMFSDFSTFMERATVLGRIRSDGGRTLPDAWVTAHPMQFELARDMVSLDPAARPSCGQVLSELLREGLWKRKNPTFMETLVVEQHNRILDLKAELDDKDATISQLRRLLDEQGIPHGHVA